eukprot:7671561-Heterocapsa_arctica.AAC.1
MPTEGTAAVALAALPAPPTCSRDFRSASFRWRSRCRSLLPPSSSEAAMARTVSSSSTSTSSSRCTPPPPP